MVWNGTGNVGITLNAHILEEPWLSGPQAPYFLSNYGATIPPSVQILAVANVDYPPVYVADWLIPPEHPHFPYGAVVEPDKLP